MDVNAEAARYVDAAAKEVPDVAAALAGARDICAERIAEHADIRQLVREGLAKDGTLRVTKLKEHAEAVTKFDMYASFEEPVAKIPSHRYLAIRRGETDGVLSAGFHLEGEPLLAKIRHVIHVNGASPWASELLHAAEDAYKRLVLPSAEVDQRIDLKMQSDRAAVDVFAQNLRELLLGAPYGTKTVLGIDPGQRTGCKCALVDATGKLLSHEVLYLVQGKDAVERSKSTLRALCKGRDVCAIAIGDGTHGRETEQFVREFLAAEGMTNVLCVAVSEAAARRERPFRERSRAGRIPGFGFDGPGSREHRSASSGSARGARENRSEEHRRRTVPTRRVPAAPCQEARRGRGELREPSRRGAQHGERAAPRPRRGHRPRRRETHRAAPGRARSLPEPQGALEGRRHRPADVRASGGVPKSQRRRASARCERRAPGTLRRGRAHGGGSRRPARLLLVGNANALSKVNKESYFGDGVGEFTMNDIVQELGRPGRDPRATFEPPKFRDDVRTMDDLRPGMDLEGVVTNVTAFGAFVNVGVHQDGLVHVSKLSDRFVRDPSDVVKVGDKLKVRVLEVDLERKRISLSAKTEDFGKKYPEAPFANFRDVTVGEQGRKSAAGPRIKVRVVNAHACTDVRE